MEMALTYDFHVLPPAARLAISIVARDAEGPLLVAALASRRQPLTDATLARAAVAYPLMTLKVIAGIHWEALLLWIKGVRLHARPAPPAHPVTITRPSQS